MNRYSLILLLMLGISASLAKAGCLDQPNLRGVNSAGAEFNSKKLPGIADKDYTYPTLGELTYIAAQGANVIRLPFRWERLQPTLFAPLNAAEQARLQYTVDMATTLGLCVIFDAHNYAKYADQALANNTNLQNAFVDFWLRTANAFPATSHIAFGLMNEPKNIAIGDWAILAKRTLASLRSAGSQHLLLVAGGNWSGLHDWFVVRDGHSNANAFADLRDPLNRTLIEVHQYADANYSGTGTECLAAEHFDPRFQAIAAWAQEHQHQLFLGEFGVAQNPTCLATLAHFLNLMDNPIWRGWTYWATGRWWGSYPLALNTNSLTPSLQWPLLQEHFLQSQVRFYNGDAENGDKIDDNINDDLNDNIDKPDTQPKPPEYNPPE